MPDVIRGSLVRLVALVALVAGCAVPAASTRGGFATTAPATVAPTQARTTFVAQLATPSASATGPLTRIRSVTLSVDHRVVTLNFVGGPHPTAGDPCSTD